LEESLPCPEIGVLRKVVWRIVGLEGIGQWRRGYGSLGIIGEFATEDEYLFL
jgi:hypothetical protein